MFRVHTGRVAGLPVPFAVFVVVSAVWGSNDWPTFRGSDRTAVSRETGLLQEWPKEGPPLLWDGQGAGRGYSSLAIADGRIYTLGDGPSGADDKDGGNESLVCFGSGFRHKRLWKAKTGPAFGTRGQRVVAKFEKHAERGGRAGLRLDPAWRIGLL